MLEFGFRAGMLGFATSSTRSFVFRSYWFIFWQILDRGQWWVSLAVLSLLSLFESSVDQESFQGTGELRFFLEYLALKCSTLQAYPIEAKEHFLQHKQWWITLLHAEMCSWYAYHIEPGYHVWSEPPLAETASSNTTHTSFDSQRHKWWTAVYVYSTFMDLLLR